MVPSIPGIALWELAEDTWTVDETTIIPISKRGSTRRRNLWLFCWSTQKSTHICRMWAVKLGYARPRMTWFLIRELFKDDHTVWLFVSLLNNFRLINFFAYTCFYQPYVGLDNYKYSITPETAKVSTVTTCKIQVFATDHQTVPTVAKWSFEATVLPINPDIYTESTNRLHLHPLVGVFSFP